MIFLLTAEFHFNGEGEAKTFCKKDRCIWISHLSGELNAQVIYHVGFLIEVPFENF